MRSFKSIITMAGALAIVISSQGLAQQKPNPPVAKVKGTDKKVFVSVEKSPAFPGGQKALGTYLSKNTKYPVADKENNVQGKVFVSFIVEPDGSLSDVKAVRGPSATLQAEAVRVIKSSPKWIAGAQRGKKVRVQYTVPVNFVLQDESASNSKPAKPIAPLPKNQSGGKVYVSVQKSPEFPGGFAEMAKFLKNNVNYPVVDKDNNTQGKVYVSFVVEPDGKLSDIVAVRGPSETLKSEAIRVMKNSPTWKPGVQDGKAVRTQYTVPINFSLGS